MAREPFCKEEEQGKCKLRFLFKQQGARCSLLQRKDGLSAEARGKGVRAN